MRSLSSSPLFHYPFSFYPFNQILKNGKVTLRMRPEVHGSKRHTYPYTKANVDRQTDLNEKGMRARRPPHTQSLTLILDTDGSLSFSLLYTLSPFVALLNSRSPAVLLPLSFIFLCPLPSFCYPSEAGGLARGWHSQAELRWEVVFTVHTKLHSKSDDWCSWKCLLQGKTSSIVFDCQREYSWQLAIWVKRTCQWRMDA